MWSSTLRQTGVSLSWLVPASGNRPRGYKLSQYTPAELKPGFFLPDLGPMNWLPRSTMGGLIMTIGEPDGGVVNGRHPLAESIGRAAALNEFFSLPVRYPDPGRWIEAVSLFQDDGQRLGDMVVAYGQERWGTDNAHLAGSGFIVAYLTRVAYPLNSQFVLERRVPDVSLSNLAFHWDGQRIDGTALNRPSFAALPNDPASGHPDAQVVLDEAALYARLKEWLFESNFQLVIPSLHRAARASLKVSLNAVASHCAGVFCRLYDLAEEPELVVRDAEAFFGDPSSPVYGQVTLEAVEHRGKRVYFARRAGCCLLWRAERSNGYCSDCILLTHEQQDQRIREALESRR